MSGTMSRPSLPDPPPVLWVLVDAIGQTEAMRTFDAAFRIGLKRNQLKRGHYPHRIVEYVIRKDRP